MHLVNIVCINNCILMIINCVLTESLNISLTVSMNDLWFGSGLKTFIEIESMPNSQSNKTGEQYRLLTLGCIKTNGSSAETSPPRAPKKSFILTAYETIIPNASRFSGVASLKIKQRKYFFLGKNRIRSFNYNNTNRVVEAKLLSSRLTCPSKAMPLR